MAKATFDIKDLAHAGVGAADLAFEAVKELVATAQKSVKEFDLEPDTLRSQATLVLNDRLEGLSKDATSRRTAIEARVAELRTDAQKFLAENAETAASAYADLAKRGETVVKRLLKETSSTVDPGPVLKATGETAVPKKAPAKAPAKKAPAKKATGAKKATAKKSTAKKTAAE